MSKSDLKSSVRSDFTDELSSLNSVATEFESAASIEYLLLFGDNAHLDVVGVVASTGGVISIPLPSDALQQSSMPSNGSVNSHISQSSSRTVQCIVTGQSDVTVTAEVVDAYETMLNHLNSINHDAGSIASTNSASSQVSRKSSTKGSRSWKLCRKQGFIAMKNGTALDAVAEEEGLVVTNSTDVKTALSEF
jgi:lysine/ornithine N-monooxygenase